MKIKIIFGTFLIAIIVLVAYGSQVLANQMQQGKDVFAMTKKTLEYNKIFYGDHNQPLLASVANVFLNSESSFLEEGNQGNSNSASIPVILYHGIVEKSDRFNITPSVFVEQMTALHGAGYQAISIEQFNDFIKNQTPLPSKPILITFDDGRKDSYYGAHPVLKALGYKATMFIAGEVSFFSEKKSHYYLSENELKKMSSSGVWDIQSHAMQKTGGIITIDENGTRGNFLSNKMWLANLSRLETDDEYSARISWELSNSKKILEEKFVNSVSVFAYPFGDYGQQQVNTGDARAVIAKNLSEAGYDFAFRQVWDNDADYTHNYPSNTPFLLKRIEPSPTWSGVELVERLSSGEEKLLPYKTNVFRISDWRTSWGSHKVESGALRVSTSNISTGSSTFLDGTLAWRNYIFNSVIDWNKGSHVSIIGRLKDNKNYVACVFNDKGLRIEQYLNGEKRIMVEKDTFFEMPKKDVQLGIVVNGDKVECLVNGNSVIYAYYLSPTLSHGGIGFKTWDPEINNSEIVVKNVEVLEISGDDKDALVGLPKAELVLKEVAKKNIATVINAVKPKVEDPKPVPVPKPVAVPVPVKAPAPAIVLSSTPYAVTDFTPLADLWTNLSGKYFVREGALHVASNASTTAGFAVLEGASGWTNYRFKATADWRKGSTFTLIARYKDSKNYMSCTFSYYGLYAKMYETVNGKTKKLGGTGKMSTPYESPWLNTNLGVNVSGDDIECLVNNEWVLRYNRTSMPKAGGIGFKTWDAQKDNSEIIIKKILVEQLP